MLKQIQKALKGVVAWFFVALLILTFGLFGVPEMRDFASRSALKVGDERFSRIEIDREFQQLLTNRRLQTQQSLSREDAIKAGLHEELLRSIALRSSIEQEATRMGLSMPRAVVKDFLATSEQFRNPRTGKFDNEVVGNILRDYNLTAMQFEDQIGKDLLRSQVVRSLIGGPPAPTGFVDALVLREIERRTVDYVVVSEDMAAPGKEPTADQLKKFYDADTTRFMEPEFRRFSVLTLKEDDFASDLAAPEAELRKIYDAAKASEYDKPERRSFYQLTFGAENEARAAAEALKGGAPFEQLATRKGFTLASVTYTDQAQKEVLDPAVGGAIFATEQSVGAVIGPVKGSFGHVVAQVIAITPPSTTPFEEVRPALEQRLLESERRKRLFEAVEDVESARDTGATLAEAANKVGLKAIEFGPVDSFSFGSGGEIIPGLTAEVLTEAFKLEEGEESEAAEFADKSGYFFVGVSEVVEPAKSPFEKVAGEVEAGWRADDRNRRIGAAVAKIRDGLKGGKSLADALKDSGRAPLSLVVDRRTQNEAFSKAMVDQVFAAAKGAPVSGAVEFGAGEVIAIVRDVAFDNARLTPNDLGQFTQMVTNQIDQELLDAYVTALREDLGVKESKSQIDQLFGEAQ